MDEITGQPGMGKAPEPVGDPIDSPAGLVCMQVGASFGFLEDLLISGRKNVREPLPHLDEAAWGKREVKVDVEDVHNVGEGHAQAVVESGGEDQGTVSDGGPGQGVGDRATSFLHLPHQATCWMCRVSSGFSSGMSSV